MASDSAVSLGPNDLGEALPGTWDLLATNFPVWLGGERGSPRFDYRLVALEPLVLGSEVSWFEDGRERRARSVDPWKGDRFVRRGRGIRLLSRCTWVVAGASSARDVLALRFDKSLGSAAGIDIIARAEAGVEEPRALVARSASRFGLSAEDFASLSWLDRFRVR